MIPIVAVIESATIREVTFTGDGESEARAVAARLTADLVAVVKDSSGCWKLRTTAKLRHVKAALYVVRTSPKGE